jgi:hypothetical protein
LRAVAELYHRYLTGILLGLVHRQGTTRAAEVTFRTFRRQHLEKFLPGLRKLGLDGLPPAVACAQYHYLSNALGGVSVEWLPESDRKSWVRYLPPRWVFDGTAVCGIPTEVSRAMLWGWHAHNGVSLGNPRLGFVCTSQVTDAGAGLVGYYVEEDRELAPDERLRFSPGERPPGNDPAGNTASDAGSVSDAGRSPASATQPSVDWSPDRLAKVERNYAMEYVRSVLPELCAVLGPPDGGHVGRTAGRQIGMQYHGALCSLLAPTSHGGSGSGSGSGSCSGSGSGSPASPASPATLSGPARASADVFDGSPEAFGRLLARLSAAQGDPGEVEASADGREARVRVTTWRLMAGVPIPPEAFEAWNGLWEGLAAVHGGPPGLRIDAIERLDLGDDHLEWRIRRR